MIKTSHLHPLSIYFSLSSSLYEIRHSFIFLLESLKQAAMPTLASTVFAFHARWTFTDLIPFNKMIYDSVNANHAAVAVTINGNEGYDG